MKRLGGTVASLTQVMASSGTPGVPGVAGFADTDAQTSGDRTVLIGAISALGYYLGSLLGLTLQLVPSTVSSLWPPNAFLLGMLLLTSRRQWWIVLAAALPAHLLAHGPSGIPTSIMLIQFAGNILQATSSAIALQYLVGEQTRFDRLKDVVMFIVSAAILVPALVSLLSVGVFEAIGWKEDVWTPWRTRFQSNALAVLTITPLVVLLWQKRAALISGLTLRRTVELIALTAGLVVAGYWTAATPGSESQLALPLLYLSVPLLLLAAVRFGLAGVCVSVLALAAVKVWVAFYGSASLGQDPGERALAFGLFLIVTAIPLLLLATLLEERDSANRTARGVSDDLQKLMESTAAIPWQADLESSTITYIGPQSADLLGYSEQDWRRRGFWLSRLHPEDREMAWRIYETARQSTESFEFDCRVTAVSGKSVWLHNTVRCEHRNGKPWQLRGFMIDITGRKQAESAEQRHRAEMAQINRVATMGEFAASITHEVFQPLGAILNSAEAAELFLSADPPALDDARELLADIRKDDGRAVEIIRRTRNLLQKHEIVLKPVDLNALVGEVLRLLNVEAESRNVRVRFEPDPDLPEVSGDRIHLQQVMINLALNAFEAMADQPGVRRLDIRTDYSDRETSVTVSDTGPGFAEDVRPKLFEPFFTTKSKGLGMGLSITRTIIDAHHGRIAAENNPDVGATFVFAVPLPERNRS